MSVNITMADEAMVVNPGKVYMCTALGVPTTPTQVRLVEDMQTLRDGTRVRMTIEWYDCRLCAWSGQTWPCWHSPWEEQVLS